MYSLSRGRLRVEIASDSTKFHDHAQALSFGLLPGEIKAYTQLLHCLVKTLSLLPHL